MRQRTRLLFAAGVLIAGYLLIRLAYELSVALAGNRLSPGIAALAPAPLYIGLAIMVSGVAGKITSIRLIGPAFAGPRKALLAAGGAVFGIVLAASIFGFAFGTGLIQATPHRLSAHFALSLAAGACIAASIACAEETVFRGSLIPILARVVPARTVVPLTAALFAAVHFRGPATGPVYLAGVFLLGMVLGLVYSATKTIWCPIGLHAGWNLVQAGALLLHQGGTLLLRQPEGRVVVGGLGAIEGGLLGPALLFAASLMMLRYVPRSLSPPSLV